MTKQRCATIACVRGVFDIVANCKFYIHDLGTSQHYFALDHTPKQLLQDPTGTPYSHIKLYRESHAPIKMVCITSLSN